MVTGAGKFHKAKVPLQHHDLGHRRNAGKTQPRRHFAFVHLAVSGETRFFRALDDQQSERRGVGKRAAHDQRISYRCIPVGKGKRARFRQNAEFRQFLAYPSPGHSGVGVYFDDVRFARPAGKEFHDRYVVDRRVGFRQADNGRHATGRRGRTRTLEAFLVLLPRFRQVHPHIDQPRCQAVSPAINRADAIRHAVCEQGRVDIQYLVAINQHATCCIQPAGRIDHAGVDVGSAVGCRRGHEPLPLVLRDRLRVTMSRQAMRTATPISTCSWMTLR